MATRCTRVPRVRRSRQRPDTSPAARCATPGPRANGSPSAPAARCVWKGWAHVWWKTWKSKPQLKYVEICWTMLKWPSWPGRVLFLVVSTVVLVPLIVGELPICFWSLYHTIFTGRRQTCAKPATESKRTRVGSIPTMDTMAGLFVAFSNEPIHCGKTHLDSSSFNKSNFDR